MGFIVEGYGDFMHMSLLLGTDFGAFSHDINGVYHCESRDCNG